MVDTNKNNVLIIINYVNNYEKYCVYHYPKKFVSANIYIPSLVFFFFFFSLNTPDNFTCRGFPDIKNSWI